MVLQHIYGRDPVIGYCDKKYSKVLDAGEVLTSKAVLLDKKIVSSKINYVLPQYLYGDLPDCYYLIHRAGCAVFGKSTYIEAGRSEYINHNYIFTDIDKAIDVCGGESVFDANVFLSRIEQAENYDVENAVLAENNFDISVAAKTMKSLGIDKALFESIVFAVIEAACLGTRVYFVPKNMNKRFTEDIIEVIKGIFYVLPKVLLENLGFITYSNTFSSLSNTLDGSIRLVCIEKTVENTLMFEDVLTDGNFIVQLDGYDSEVLYPQGICSGGLTVMELFSGAVFDNAGIEYKSIFEKPYKFPVKTYILNIIYIDNNFKGSEAASKVKAMLKLSESFEDLFGKFGASLKYFSEKMLFDILYHCVATLLKKSNYSNITDFAQNAFAMKDSKDTDNALASKLDRMIYFFVDKYFDTVNNVIGINEPAAEHILLWSERLISYIRQSNYYKLTNITSYKRLRTAILNISTDCIDYYNIADSCVRKKLSREISYLTTLYIKNTDESKNKAFCLILPVLLESYLEAFKLAWTKGGLQEVMRFVTESENNSLIQDLEGGQLSLNEIDRSLRLFFKKPANASFIEKAAKSDTKIKAFAKKYRLL